MSLRRLFSQAMLAGLIVVTHYPAAGADPGGKGGAEEPGLGVIYEQLLQQQEQLNIIAETVTKLKADADKRAVKYEESMKAYEKGMRDWEEYKKLYDAEMKKYQRRALEYEKYTIEYDKMKTEYERMKKDYNKRAKAYDDCISNHK